MTVTQTQVERIDVDPRNLLVDLNVRLNPNLNRAFVASIKDLGVLQPIVAVRTASGDIRVRYGHRRTLASIEAGLETVPVEVIGDEGTDDAAEIARIVAQHAENSHRAALTSAEEVSVVEQLAAFGLSATDIQRRTHMKRPNVNNAIAVANSQLARAAADRYDFLTLEQAAAVAEFDDAPDAVKALVSAAKSGQFEHVVQRLRDERADNEARLAVEQRLTEAGISVIDRPGWNDTPQRLSRLTENGVDIKAESHSGCPGHAAFIEEQWTTTAEGEDADRYEYVAIYVCTDPETYGHKTPGRTLQKAKGSDSGDAENAREERRRVLANNKAWRSAEAVRRDWLRSFLKRKTAPKDALRFLLREVAIGGFEICQAMEKHHGMELDLLGLAGKEESGQRSGILLAALENAADSRRVVIGLGIVLAAHEAAIGVHTWRNPSWGARRYLTVLAAWGYGLSDVEQSVIGDEVAA